MSSEKRTNASDSNVNSLGKADGPEDLGDKVGSLSLPVKEVVTDRAKGKRQKDIDSVPPLPLTVGSFSGEEDYVDDKHGKKPMSPEVPFEHTSGSEFQQITKVM